MYEMMSSFFSGLRWLTAALCSGTTSDAMSWHCPVFGHTGRARLRRKNPAREEPGGFDSA
jgi:hypothetical protein